jgi:hypothetical protein
MKTPSLYTYNHSPFKSHPHLDPRRKSSKIISLSQLQTPERIPSSPILRNLKKNRRISRLTHSFRNCLSKVHSPMKNPPSPLNTRDLRDFIPGRGGLSYHFLNDPGMIPPVFAQDVSIPVKSSVILSLSSAQEWVGSPSIFSMILDYLTAEDLGLLDIATIDSDILRNNLYLGWELLKPTHPCLHNCKYYYPYYLTIL